MPAATPSGAATSRSETLRAILHSPLGLLLALVFATDAMTSLVVIAFGNSYLIETRHAPASYPAYALGIYGFVKLVTAPIGGWLLDRVRVAVIVMFIYATEAGGLLIILGTGSANGFLVGVGFLSTGIALAWLLVFHALGDASDPDARASATAYVGLVSAAATATGFGLAAVLAQIEWWESAFLAALFMCTASAFLLLRLYPPRSRAGRGHQEPPAGDTVPPPIGRRRVVAAVVIFMHFVAMTATLAVFGPFILRSLHLSLLRAGFLLTPAAAVAALSMLASGRLSRHGNRLREVAVLYALGALVVLVCAFVHSPWVFAIVAIPLGVALAGAQPLLNASLLDVSHGGSDTGTVLGWLFFAEGLGSVAGPLIIGVVISAAGIREAVVVLSIIESLMVVLAAGSSRATRI